VDYCGVVLDINVHAGLMAMFGAVTRVPFLESDTGCYKERQVNYSRKLPDKSLGAYSNALDVYNDWRLHNK
jgi:hypothetical protein